MSKLYLLTTEKLGQWYAIADDPTEAEKCLLKIFDDQDYGFKNDRKVKVIECIAEEPTIYKNRPILDKNSLHLLVVANWK